MPPSPAVTTSRPASAAAEMTPRRRRPAFRRCPARCPGCRCRSSCRPSSGRTSSGRDARDRGSFPRSPTPARAAQFAISTRGAPGCVWKTPTGLPDCTSSVSSCSSDRQRPDDRVERRPVARRLARSAVDDEIVGPLGDLGIEIVHQHPQRGFLRPAFAGQRGASWRSDGAGGSGHC